MERERERGMQVLFLIPIFRSQLHNTLMISRGLHGNKTSKRQPSLRCNNMADKRAASSAKAS